jgi:hypothetical protein
MAGIPLPAGAGGVNVGNNPTPEAEQVVEANETSLWEDIAALPGGIYAAATGEGIPIEFPNIPETTDMGDAAPGFFEAFMMNNKLMFARDDFGKAEIMEDTFGDDERWGGAFVDKFDNPMIVWNDKPYYVNKPGFSGQDIGTLTGEIIKFAPASKFVSGAKTLGQTIMRGTGAYSGTELAGQAGEALLTPETTKAKDQDMGDVAGDVGVATGLGVAVDVLAPPVIKGTSKALRAGTGTVSETAAKIFPRFEPKNIQTSKYELTQGQRTAPLPDRKAGPTEKVTPELEAEDVMRRAPGTNPDAANIIRGFDERQLDEIRTDAAALADEFGSGRPDITGAADVPTAAAEEIQSTGVSAARDLKSRAGKAYDVVQGAEFQPVMNRDGVMTTSQRALDSVLSP